MTSHVAEILDDQALRSRTPFVQSEIATMPTADAVLATMLSTTRPDRRAVAS